MSGTGSIDELYAAHVPSAVRFAYLLTGDAHRAEDVAHDAFLSAAARLGALRDPDRFGAYLRKAVTRRVLSDARSRDRERRRMERVAPTEGLDPMDAAVAEHMSVMSLLEVLTPRQRAVVILRFWHDLPETEIARMVGCRPGTVKSTLSRALDALRLEVPADV